MNEPFFETFSWGVLSGMVVGLRDVRERIGHEVFHVMIRETVEDVLAFPAGTHDAFAFEKLEPL